MSFLLEEKLAEFEDNSNKKSVTVSSGKGDRKFPLTRNSKHNPPYNKRTIIQKTQIQQLAAESVDKKTEEGKPKKKKWNPIINPKLKIYSDDDDFREDKSKCFSVESMSMLPDPDPAFLYSF